MSFDAGNDFSQKNVINCVISRAERSHYSDGLPIISATSRGLLQGEFFSSTPSDAIIVELPEIFPLAFVITNAAF